MTRAQTAKGDVASNRRVEQDYFRRTGCFPPQHLIVIRRELWEANRRIAKAITSGRDDVVD